MDTFKGFEATDGPRIAIPSIFFAELLPRITDFDELKVTLFAMWALQQREGTYRYLRRADFDGDAAAVHGLDADAIERGLAQAVTRGTLITAALTLDAAPDTLYFANSPAGRAAVQQVNAGRWLPGEGGTPIVILPPRPTVYHLYEENIGALTPLVADDLKDTETEFGSEALADAIRYAVTAEKRSMRYIRAVLEGWRREGKINAQTGGHPQGNENRQLLSGKYADFVER